GHYFDAQSVVFHSDDWKTLKSPIGTDVGHTQLPKPKVNPGIKQSSHAAPEADALIHRSTRSAVIDLARIPSPQVGCDRRRLWSWGCPTDYDHHQGCRQPEGKGKSEQVHPHT